MAVIKVPGRINDSFGDGINWFFTMMHQIRSYQTTELIVLDMANCAFLNPFFLLPFMLLIKEESKTRNITIINNDINPKVKSYMNLVSFGEGLKPEEIIDHNYEMVLNKYLNKTYIPIVNFPVTRSSLHTAIRDKFLDVLNSLLVQQLKLNYYRLKADRFGLG